MVVSGASGIADHFGIDRFIIGATIVALGTSTPEIATAIVAKLHRQDEVGLGTILGSNIFNGLFIIGTAATICPIPGDRRETAIALLFGVCALAFVYPGRAGLIQRWQGVLLLVLYAAYLFAIIKYRTA